MERYANYCQSGPSVCVCVCVYVCVRAGVRACVRVWGFLLHIKAFCARLHCSFVLYKGQVIPLVHSLSHTPLSPPLSFSLSLSSLFIFFSHSPFSVSQQQICDQINIYIQMQQHKLQHTANNLFPSNQNTHISIWVRRTNKGIHTQTINVK